MDELPEGDPRVLWSFWLSCGLAASGGLAPLLLAAGGPNRLAGAILPYAVAAVAMALNALMYKRGRSLAAILYFLAGVAIAYGMLLMFSVPLRLSVTGTCPEPPEVCPPGIERGFSSGEATGFTIAVIVGMLSILSGFFGLLIYYRRMRPQPLPPPMTRTARSLAEATPVPAEAAPAATPKAAPDGAPEPPSAETSEKAD